MSTIPVNLAIEDELSEVVLRRVLTYLDRGYSVGTAYRRGGYGFLRRTILGWNRAAKGIPFIVLTDLDMYECPKALIAEWLQEPQNASLVFRIAVREIESWLLADSHNFARFLGISQDWIPEDPDCLLDPKAALIKLAQRSRSKEVRDRIVPKAGSTAKQGADYNGQLARFVLTDWNIEASGSRSPSLARALTTLAEFNPVWPPL
jgi:hypothetical protein